MKGFNECDLNLLKHLITNKKPLLFVRTQCDNAIRGMQDENEDDENAEEKTPDELFVELKQCFAKYMEENVTKSVNKKIGKIRTHKSLVNNC